MKYIPATGPERASLVAVGEAPGAEEERLSQNFIGTSGRFLRALLSQNGINPDEVLYLNVSRFRPRGNDILHFIKPLPKKLPFGWEQRIGTNYLWPNEPFDSDLEGNLEIYKDKLVLPFIKKHVARLFYEISIARPRVVLALGATALWALTGKPLSIGDWKGSVIPSSLSGHNFLLIPLQHPAAILRRYPWKFHTEQYIRKARYFISAAYALPKPKFLTRPTFAETIHFLDKLSGPTIVDIETTYRIYIDCIGICNEDEEVICIPFVENGQHYWTLDEELAIILLLRAKLTTLPIIGQNFFYDAQYVANWFMCIPNLVFDTMLAHHTIFPSTEKALDYISSLYLPYHIYWKDESGSARWVYNCKDCLATKQVADVLKRMAVSASLETQVAEQNALYLPVLKMMLRGIQRDDALTEQLDTKLLTQLEIIKKAIQEIVGYKLNPGSKPQVKDLFYQQLAQKLVLHRTTKQPSVDKASMDIVGFREPALQPITTLFKDYASTSTTLSTFVRAKSDPDGRLRYSLNIAGTKTFRFASSKAVSGNGLNIQNVKRGPDIRRMFIPDPGYTIIDADLKNAEFQIVVWESGDSLYKQMLKAGLNIHKENAKLLNLSYDGAKGFIHATDYLASPRTCALQFGLAESAARNYQAIYFREHPHIKQWHHSIERELKEKHALTNILGYRTVFHDRLSACLTDATDWKPQSTIAAVTNRGILNIHKNLPEVQMLFQSHDSIISQVPTDRVAALVPLIIQNMLIPLPYSDPLTIPVEVKTSTKSWGEVEPWKL